MNHKKGETRTQFLLPLFKVDLEDRFFDTNEKMFETSSEIRNDRGISTVILGIIVFIVIIPDLVC